MMAGITWPGQAAGLCRTSPGCPMLALLTSVLEGASVDMLARSELPPMADQTEIGSSCRHKGLQTLVVGSSQELAIAGAACHPSCDKPTGVHLEG